MTAIRQYESPSKDTKDVNLVFADVYQHLPCSAIILNSSNQIIYMNDAAKNLYQLKEQDCFNGRKIDEYITIESVFALENALNNSISTAKTMKINITITTGKNSFKSTSCQIKAIKDQNAKTTYTLLTQQNRIPSLIDMRLSMEELMSNKRISKCTNFAENALIADFDSISQFVIGSQLQSLSYNVTVAQSWQETLDQLQEKDYTLLVISDQLDLPESCIREKIKTLYPDIALIAITDNQTKTTNPEEKQWWDGAIRRPLLRNDIDDTVSQIMPTTIKIVDYRKELEFLRTAVSVGINPSVVLEIIREPQIHEEIKFLIDKVHDIVDKIAWASKNTGQDMLKELSKNLMSSRQSKIHKESVSALEHMILSLITAKQIEIMRGNVEKLCENKC